MSVNFRKLFLDQQRQEETAADLRQLAMQPRVPQQNGRIASPMHIGEGLAQLGQAFFARRAQKKADETGAQISNAQRAQFGLPPIQAEPSRRQRRKQQAQAAVLAGQPIPRDPEDEAFNQQYMKRLDEVSSRLQALYGPPEPEQGPPEPQRQTMPDLGIGNEAALHLYQNNPELYWRMHQARQAQQAPQTLSEGAQLVDPNTGELIAENQRVNTSGAERRVHSGVVLDNGNIGYLDAFTGEVHDTGKKASDRYSFHEGTGGGVVPLNTRTGEASPPVISPEDATRESATRRAMEVESEAQARERVKVETEVPNDIATLDESIRKTEEVLNRFRRGDFQTGPLAGRLPAVTTAGQELESYAGEDILQRISSATFGALSEGERDFLRKSGLNRGNTEAANIAILERRLTALENAKRAASNRLQRVGRGGGAAPQGDGWSIQRVD